MCLRPLAEAEPCTERTVLRWPFAVAWLGAFDMSSAWSLVADRLKRSFDL